MHIVRLLQILILCHLFCQTFTVLSFLELKGHLEKKHFIPRYLSSIQAMCFHLRATNTAVLFDAILSIRHTHNVSYAGGALIHWLQEYWTPGDKITNLKTYNVLIRRLKQIDGVNPPCVNQKTDICVPLGNFMIYSLFFSFLFILLPLQLCISTSSTSSLVRFRNWKLLGYIWKKTGPPCSIKCYTVKNDSFKFKCDTGSTAIIYLGVRPVFSLPKRRAFAHLCL